MIHAEAKSQALDRRRHQADQAPEGRPPEELADGIVPGPVFRISPTGARSFVLSYQREGKQTRQTVGRYPETTLAEARHLAQQIRERQAAQ